METLETWLAILSVIAVLAFGIYYNAYLMRSKGCTAFRLGRIVSLGITSFLALGGEKNHPAYIVVMLLLIIAVVFITMLNQRDCKSWFHAVLMTVWQVLVAITIVYVLCKLSEISDKHKKT